MYESDSLLINVAGKCEGTHSAELPALILKLIFLLWV